MASPLPSRPWGRALRPSSLGAALGTLAAALLALLIGLFSLRVRAIFFAMVTLAVASAFELLVSQLSFLTGGEDGLNYTIPLRADAGVPALRGARAGRAPQRPAARLLPDLLRLRRAVPVDAADRQLAVRPGAAGGPRERVPRRGDRLSRGLLPHRSPPCCRPPWRRWPAPCWRSGCATPGPPPRSRWRSWSTSC